MSAELYVYAYVFLSIVYAAGCVQYLNVLTRSAAYARDLKVERDDEARLRLLDESARDATQGAVRSLLSIDSAAFACAVLPVAYVAVTGLLGNLISRNTSSAVALNPVWLVLTVTLVVAHMFFLSRIMSLTSRLRSATDAALSGSFVSRHTSMLNYYRVFILAVTLFTVANTLYLIATRQAVIAMPYVGF